MAQYPYEQELDFNEARADLDNVLQDIVAKANAGEDSSDLNKSLDEDSDTLSTSTSERNKQGYSDVDSPRKSSTKSSRKRKKKEDVKEEKHKPNSCVMRLFDRSVDLAQFSEDTPLYPICRAWMNNDPYEKKQSQLYKTDENEVTSEDESVRYVTMPPPNKAFNNFLSDGHYVSPRIPSPILQPDDKLEDYLQNKKSTPSASNLLLNHLQHWKSVRDKWIVKSNENEARYEDGMSMLKDMATRPLYTSLPT